MPKRPIRADDLLRLTYVGDPQMAPDGSRVLFSFKTVGEKNNYVTNLFTVDREGKTAQLTQSGKESQGRWSPDGTQIAFVSGRETPAQIYLLSFTGGEARKLSSMPEGSFGEFRWSPDGSMVAFTFREAIPERTQEAVKERTEKGLSDPPLITDDIWYRMDGDGYFGMQRNKLYLLDVATGEHRVLYTESVSGEYHFDWSPDSRELAVAHPLSKRPFADPPNDQIWRVDLDGQAWQLEGLPKGQKSSVRWSPDGKTIAYAGDVDENDPWGTRNMKIYSVDAGGGEARDLTGHLDYDLAVATLSDTKEAAFGTILEWAPDGSGLYVQVGTQGETQLGFVPREGGVELLTEGHHHVGVGTPSRDGSVISVTFGTATRMPEVGIVGVRDTGAAAGLEVLTSFNRAFHDEVRIVEPEEFRVPSTDGIEVHAWVLKPVGYLEPRRYPAVLEIHGGPHTQYGWAFFHEMQLLAAEGYVVVYSNPRGSKGYGEAFTSAIRGNWGDKDWDDVQAVTRWMQAQPYIHPGQMAVMGGSYGGYMTNWVIGHTDEFRCAITDRCVSNMVSMAGNSDFPFNKNGYFHGVAWGGLDDIKELWRQSPIAYFENVKTPTLIIHSEGDLRCNIEQSEEVFTALQQQGIESRFVRYPASTSHGMSRSGPPDLRLHRLGEITSWLGRFLK